MSPEELATERERIRAELGLGELYSSSNVSYIVAGIWTMVGVIIATVMALVMWTEVISDVLFPLFESLFVD